MAKERLSDEEKKKRRSEYYRKYYAKNKGHIRENQKEYYAENREGIREDQNASYWDSKGPGAKDLHDKDQERRKQEREAKAKIPKRVPKTKEEIAAREKEYGKKYYAENKEEIARKNKIYRKENKEELKAKGREYVEEHREEINAKARKSHAENRERNAERSRIYRQTPEGKAKSRESDRRKSAREHGAEVFPMPDNYEDLLFENQGGLCYYCKSAFDKETMLLTHLVPHSRGGPHSFDNVALGCKECATRKMSKTAEEFLLEMKCDNIDGFLFCKKCMKCLPANEFSSDKSRKGGMAAWCKECMDAINKERIEQYRITIEEDGLPETKVCTKCLLELPISDFYNNSSTKDGKSSHCKECMEKSAKRYREEHIDEIRERERKRREENRDEDAIMAKKYPFGIPKDGFKFCRKCEKELPLEDFYKNKGAGDGKSSYCIECMKKYYIDNKERINAYVTEYNNKNREKINRERREKYAENREEMRAQWKAWYDTPEGKAKDKARVDLRRARRKKAKVGEIPDGYREILHENQNGLCYYCKRDLDVTGTHLDHKNSLSRGGEHSFDNFALACPDCNMRKGTMSEDEFIAYHNEHPEEFDYWIVDDG